MKKLKALYYSLYIILALIVIGFYLINYGNPIIKARVEKDAKEYIKTHYADLDLETKSISYQMMGGFYIVELQDKESKDTNFKLNYDAQGKFMYTTYDEILGNTYERNLDVRYYSGRIIPTADKAEEGMAEPWWHAISVDRVMEKTIVDGNMETLERLYERKK